MAAIVTFCLASLTPVPAVIAPSLTADTPPVRLYAAGSLRGAMLDIAKGFTAAYGIAVDANFKSSGLLREGFEKGTAGDVFASADIGNPQKLQQEGLSGPVVLFARNQLCAIARPGLALTSATLLSAMLEPAMKLGTSAPRHRKPIRPATMPGRCLPRRMRSRPAAVPSSKPRRCN
jgi:molybdate transport system substrate-binding protein